MKRNVLIVDDDHDARNLLTIAFHYLGWESQAVSNGRLALESVRQSIPDLIMLDLMMPEMNGFETLTHLKANPRTRNIPVIIMSALASDHSIRHLGASRVMPKGRFTVEALQQAIKEMDERSLSADKARETRSFASEQKLY